MKSRRSISDTSRDRQGISLFSANDGPERSTGFSRTDFLDALFRRYFEVRDGFVLVRSEIGRHKKASIRHFPSIDALARETFPAHYEVFFGVCPRETVRSGPESLIYCTALWTTLDMAPEGERLEGDYFHDEKTAARAVRAFPLRPSMIVESGLSLHLYWLLKQPTKIERASQLEEILDRIHKYFNGSLPTKMDAMLRLPDTAVIGETGPVRPCKVKFISIDFSYSIAEIQTGLALVDRCRRGI